jgi:hypothetical protein
MRRLTVMIFAVLLAGMPSARAHGFPVAVQAPSAVLAAEIVPSADVAAPGEAEPGEAEPGAADSNPAIVSQAPDAIGDPKVLFGVSMVFVLMAILIGILLYMLPALIAKTRSHRNGPTIALVNVFTGWTFLGWVGCLMWALNNAANN